MKAPSALGLATALLAAVTLAGCATDPAEREWKIRAATIRHQRMIAQAQCESTLEVFPPGMQPRRPFRVLGPVEGNFGFTVEARFAAMRKKACALGAHAILDADERYVEIPGPTTTTTGFDRYGRPVTVIQEPRQTVRRTTALAIVYVDDAPPAR